MHLYFLGRALPRDTQMLQHTRGVQARCPHKSARTVGGPPCRQSTRGSQGYVLTAGMDMCADRLIDGRRDVHENLLVVSTHERERLDEPAFR